MSQQNYQAVAGRIGGMMSQSIGPVRVRHRKTSSEVIPLCRSESLRERKRKIRRKLNQLADEFYRLKYDHEEESRELKNLMQRGELLEAKVQIVRTKVITDNEKMKESMRKEGEEMYLSPNAGKDMGETRLNTEISSNNSDTEIIVDSLQVEVEISLEQRQIQILEGKYRQDQKQLGNKVKAQLLAPAQDYCQSNVSVPKLICLGKHSQMAQMQESVEKPMKSRRRLYQSYRGQISAVIVLLFLGIVLLLLCI